MNELYTDLIDQNIQVILVRVSTVNKKYSTVPGIDENF